MGVREMFSKILDVVVPSRRRAAAEAQQAIGDASREAHAAWLKAYAEAEEAAARPAETKKQKKERNKQAKALEAAAKIRAEEEAKSALTKDELHNYTSKLHGVQQPVWKAAINKLELDNIESRDAIWTMLKDLPKPQDLPTTQTPPYPKWVDEELQRASSLKDIFQVGMFAEQEAQIDNCFFKKAYTRMEDKKKRENRFQETFKTMQKIQRQQVSQLTPAAEKTLDAIRTAYRTYTDLLQAPNSSEEIINSADQALTDAKAEHLAQLKSEAPKEHPAGPDAVEQATPQAPSFYSDPLLTMEERADIERQQLMDLVQRDPNDIYGTGAKPEIDAINAAYREAMKVDAQPEQPPKEAIYGVLPPAPGDFDLYADLDANQDKRLASLLEQTIQDIAQEREEQGAAFEKRADRPDSPDIDSALCALVSTSRAEQEEAANLEALKAAGLVDDFNPHDPSASDFTQVMEQLQQTAVSLQQATQDTALNKQQVAGNSSLSGNHRVLRDSDSSPGPSMPAPVPAPKRSAPDSP